MYHDYVSMEYIYTYIVPRESAYWRKKSNMRVKTWNRHLSKTRVRVCAVNTGENRGTNTNSGDGGKRAKKKRL